MKAFRNKYVLFKGRTLRENHYTTYKISFSEKPLLRKINYEKQYYDGEIYLPILYSTKVKYRKTIFRVKKKVVSAVSRQPINFRLSLLLGCYYLW